MNAFYIERAKYRGIHHEGLQVGTEIKSGCIACTWDMEKPNDMQTLATKKQSQCNAMPYEREGNTVNSYNTQVPLLPGGAIGPQRFTETRTDAQLTLQHRNFLKEGCCHGFDFLQLLVSIRVRTGVARGGVVVIILT